MAHLSFLHRVALSCVLALTACHGEPSKAAARAARAQASGDPVEQGTAAPTANSAEAALHTAAADFALPYARAPWRLAEPSRLTTTVLWFSQIVIRHKDARAEVSFSPAYWSSVMEPARSRPAARMLAEQLATQAAADPSRFAELARRTSEDLPSRDEGGALGGVAADQISHWPQVLDALAALKPGETSKVVETPYGFHVFQRLEAPPLETVHGAHIVIGHDRALWGWMYARGNRPPRSREQAATLANDLYRQLREHPERFVELVHEYSEDRDAVIDGDVGAWSTREPNPFPPRLARLRELAIGQVGAPIETHLGFEIIVRTPPRKRRQYRADVYGVRVASLDSDAPAAPNPTQRAAALATARSIIDQLQHDAATFTALGPTTLQWEEGREYPDLTLAIAARRPGQFTAAPVDAGQTFFVAKRLEVEPVATPAFEIDLPVPAERELARFLAARPAQDVTAFLSRFAREAAKRWSLTTGTAARFEALHQLASDDDRMRGEASESSLTDRFDRARRLLGEEGYARYRTELSHEAAIRLLPDDEAEGPLGL